MEPKKAAVVAAVILALSGAAALVMRRPAPSPIEPPAAARPAEPLAAPPSSVAPAAPVAANLPSLDDSDAYARGRAPSLFTRALPPPWLQADGLLRRLVAAAAIVAGGESPRDSLSFLRPRGKFKVKRAGGRTVIDPASYARYDALGDAAAALDVSAAVRFVQESRPLFQQACAELDVTCDFSKAVIRSARGLLAAPLLQGETPVVEKVLVWAYADPRLEGLTKAQKHLLRLGPRNQALVQAKLRELAVALGASEAELPRLQAPAPAR